MAFIPSITQLRMARYGLEISLAEAASGAGVNPNTVNFIEIGRTKNPRIDALTKITEFYQSRGVEFGADGWVRVRPQ